MPGKVEDAPVPVELRERPDVADAEERVRAAVWPDLRAGLAFVLAGVIASGVSEIHNVYNIDRGYERIEERLRGVGADIRRVERVEERPASPLPAFEKSITR